jgi:hypothetical protein
MDNVPSQLNKNSKAQSSFKRLIIISLIGAFVIMMTGIMSSMLSLVDMIANKEAPVIHISMSDQSCTVDSDCMVVNTICSMCECGEPVNKMYEKNYNDMWQAQCKGYAGGICDYLCETPFAKCINEQCQLRSSP